VVRGVYKYIRGRLAFIHDVRRHVRGHHHSHRRRSRHDGFGKPAPEFSTPTTSEESATSADQNKPSPAAGVSQP
jgi:hypothetical protein